MKNQLFLIALIFIVVLSCNSPAKNKGEIQLNLEKANNELLNSGNLDYADLIFAEDYANQGPNYIKNMVTQIRGVFPDLNVTVENKVTEGNKHAWIRNHTGTHSAPMMGFLPLGNEISWSGIIITELDDEGMISKELGMDNLHEKLSQSSASGVYKYLPPLDGYAMIQSNKFIWTFTNIETGVQLSEFGDIEFRNGMLIYTIRHSNDPNRFNTSFDTKMVGQFGDTVRWNFINKDGEVTGSGQSIKLSN